MFINNKANSPKYYKRTFAEKVEYKGIKFNSKMEADFAMFLDGRIVKYKGVNYYHKPIRWEYESLEFELVPQETWIDKTEKDDTVKTINRNKKHTLQRVIYTPDFYLPDYNLIIEIKGFQFDDALFSLRFRLFRHKYPDANIMIIRHHEEFNKIDEAIRNINISK